MVRRAWGSGIVWQFAGGFMLGAMGLVAMQPAEANQAMASRLHLAAPAR